MKSIENSTLIKIMDYMRDNNGEIPPEFNHLVAFLEGKAIIWKIKKNKDSFQAVLSPAHQHYYEQFQRITNSFWWLSLPRKLLINIHDREFRNLKYNAEKLEKEIKKLELKTFNQ